MVKEKRKLGFWRLAVPILLLLAAVVTPILLRLHGHTVSAPPTPAVTSATADASASAPAGFDTPASAGASPAAPSSSPPPAAGGASQAPFPKNCVAKFISQDASRSGDLILVNTDWAYTFPEELALVSVDERKTASYRTRADGMLLSETVMEPVNRMMDDFAGATGLKNVALISAYRTYAYQQEVLADIIALVGAEAASRRAADPGRSEHHSGLAFDLGLYTGEGMATFTGQDAYQWIPDNCHKYGFILRYPGDKTEITDTMSEPWHFRYVGVPHAYVISENGLCLEEYYDFLRPYDSAQNTLAVTAGGIRYEIFYTRETSFLLPKEVAYTVSGDNMGGFIVTLRDWTEKASVTQAFQRVFQNEAKLLSAADKKYVYLSDYYTRDFALAGAPELPDGDLSERLEFAPVDLNGDFLPEIVLSVRGTALKTVLYYETGTVYGYPADVRDGHMEAAAAGLEAFLAREGGAGPWYPYTVESINAHLG